MPTLYYDKRLENGVYETTSMKSLRHNLNEIDAILASNMANRLTKQNLKGAVAAPAGQYLCWINISVDDNRYEMWIFDAKDEGDLNKVLEGFKHSTEAIGMLTDAYNKRHLFNRGFALLQGEPPAF
jgi:hypothetical protein